ncbi:hinge domain of cleavage stimulation factor subunit 2-domain-containing protein [Diplogelasinospora grovesii]|uniref:Hinge domain of cleavage stimulation factor subunit 2-domain-containing protein n=1 Tax=Diplogelasinospora grovesii TaxID=303347 RepID=A0AAN6S6Z3_9PEZI|nr:hinge domain of cleavage stimulation factor subunit 2-domain-containing protein [Diplogelasinospora grovesii]
MSSRPASRVVFVGNIPYGLTEEQITEIFSGAGRVLNFRLVYDRDTGRPKGFGFAEFPDYDSAASAVRNLNDYEIMGRKLRVDFSNETVGDDETRGDRDGGGNSNTGGYSMQQQHSTNGHAAAPPPNTTPASGSLPPLPQGKDLPPGMTCTDAISRTLNTLPPAQLLDILQQMKTLANSDPARATELLNQAPQLSYAVFQALLIMGLVSPDAINSVLESSGVPPQPVMPQPPVAYSGYGIIPATGTPPVGMPGGAYAAAPPVPVPTPAAAAAPAPAPPAAAAQDPEALMRAVMELPQETIDQLPEAERQQIMALRASYAAQHAHLRR